MSLRLYSSLLFEVLDPASLRRSSASADPYILRVCLFNLDDVVYQSFF